MKRAHFVAWNTQQWEARKLRENILGRINFLPNCLATSHFLAMRYREIEKRRKHGEREAEIYIATGLITESLSHYKVISIVIVICCCVSSFSFLWALLQSHSLSLFVLFSMHLPPPPRSSSSTLKERMLWSMTFLLVNMIPIYSDCCSLIIILFYMHVYVNISLNSNKVKPSIYTMAEPVQHQVHSSLASTICMLPLTSVISVDL